MEEDGVESWRLSVSVTEVPLALYVRDALRLDTAADALSPPPLLRQPPDRSGLLTAPERVEAAEQWRAWWRTVVHYAGRFSTEQPGGDFLAWYRTFAAERAAAAGEPPEFTALAESPALRRAVVELSAEADEWAGRHGSAGAAALGSAAVGTIAAELAARLGAPVSRARGTVHAYATEGDWWRVAEPGVLICSVACVRTEAAAARVVRAVFESALLAETAGRPGPVP